MSSLATNVKTKTHIRTRRGGGGRSASARDYTTNTRNKWLFIHCGCKEQRSQNCYKIASLTKNLHTLRAINIESRTRDLTRSCFFCFFQTYKKAGRHKIEHSQICTFYIKDNPPPPKKPFSLSPQTKEKQNQKKTKGMPQEKNMIKDEMHVEKRIMEREII